MNYIRSIAPMKQPAGVCSSFLEKHKHLFWSPGLPLDFFQFNVTKASLSIRVPSLMAQIYSSSDSRAATAPPLPSETRICWRIVPRRSMFRNSSFKGSQEKKQQQPQNVALGGLRKGRSKSTFEMKLQHMYKIQTHCKT